MNLTEPFQLITFIVTVLTLLLQVYVLFLIIYVSPKSMAVYRRYLVVTAVFEMLYTFDFGIVIMNEPPEFFPGAGTFVRGLAGLFGESTIRVTAAFSYFFAGFMIGSQDVCLIYRFLAVHPNRELSQKFTSTPATLISYGIVFVLSCGAGIGTYFVIAPQSEHKEIIEAWTMRSTGQHPTDIDLITPRLLLYNNRPIISYFFNAIGLCLAVSEIGYFVVVYKILKLLHVNSSSFSRKSILLHRQLTLLLAAQVLVPLLMLIGPYSLLFYRMKTQTMNGKFETQLGLIFFLSHFTVIALITIFFIKPYRNFLMEKIRYLIYRDKTPTVFTKTAVISSFNSNNTHL